MDLYEKNGNILYILNVLKKYSDEDHQLSATEIGRKVKEIYDVDVNVIADNKIKQGKSELEIVQTYDEYMEQVREKIKL